MNNTVLEVYSRIIKDMQQQQKIIFSLCALSCFQCETLTVFVFGADLGDDLQVFLNLPLEAFLSDASTVKSND